MSIRSTTWDVLWRWGRVVLWMAVIFHFSSVPHPLAMLGQVGQSPRVGILAHLAEYGLLGTLLYRALRQDAAAGRGPWLGTLLIGFVYAVSDEVHQRFVLGRHFELSDIACDLAGIITALWLARLWLSGYASRRSVHP